MSDFVNGYIEWRGRETLLKTKFGLLDKESGNHLVAIQHPYEYYDKDDIDFVASKPNQPPVTEVDGQPYVEVIPPDVTFDAVGLFKEDVVTGDDIKVTVSGNLTPINGAVTDQAFATFNGGHKTDVTMTGDEWTVEFTIPFNEWKVQNTFAIFVKASIGEDESPWGSKTISISGSFQARDPIMTVSSVMDMPYNGDIVYDLTTNRSRFDIRGSVVATQRTDVIKEIQYTYPNAGDWFDARLVQEKTHRNVEGFAQVDWIISIPRTEFTDTGIVNVDVKVEVIDDAEKYQPKTATETIVVNVL